MTKPKPRGPAEWSQMGIGDKVYYADRPIGGAKRAAMAASKWGASQSLRVWFWFDFDCIGVHIYRIDQPNAVFVAPHNRQLNPEAWAKKPTPRSRPEWQFVEVKSGDGSRVLTAKIVR